jgi:hypothetical protein
MLFPGFDPHPETRNGKNDSESSDHPVRPMDGGWIDGEQFYANEEKGDPGAEEDRAE